MLAAEQTNVIELLFWNKEKYKLFYFSLVFQSVSEILNFYQ